MWTWKTEHINPAPTAAYNDSVGTLAIKSAVLKIGGQTIQTLTGEYIEMWNDLNVPAENQPGLTLLTGKRDTTPASASRIYYINLPFYFYNNPELFIPVVALGRQNVEVFVTFNSFPQLSPSTLIDPLLDASIIAEYVLLSEPEREWFQKASIDYIITQCQYQTIDLLPEFSNSIFKLNIKNPVRELFFIVHGISDSAYSYSPLRSLGLSINGEDVFLSDAAYLGTIQPFNNYPTSPSRLYYTYSFAYDPTDPRPTGHLNFSRIQQTLLDISIPPTHVSKQFTVIAVNHNILRIENGLAGLMFDS